MRFLLAVVVLLMTATSALAIENIGPRCFPELTICNGDECVDTSTQLCTDAFTINGQFYCDIDDVVDCPGQCEDDVCVGEGGPFIPECTNGFEQCGTGDVSNPNSDVFRCVNNVWVEIEECGNNDCEEVTASRARCKTDEFFCYMQDQKRCIFASVEVNEACFPSLEECNDYEDLNEHRYCIEEGSRTCGRSDAPENEFRKCFHTLADCEASIPPIVTASNALTALFAIGIVAVGSLIVRDRRRKR